MTAATTDISQLEGALRTARDTKLFFTSFAITNDAQSVDLDDATATATTTTPAGQNVPSSDILIQTAFDEIRQLKAQLTPLKTKTAFMSHVLTRRPLEHLARAKELALAEGALRTAKETLRDIKKRRTSAEQRLPTLIGEVAGGVRRRDAGMAGLERRVCARRAAVRAGEVGAAIRGGDLGEVERIVGVIDEVDAEGCAEIIEWVRRQKVAADREAVVVRGECAEVGREVEEVRARVERRSARVMELEGRVARIDGCVKGAGVLREETERQESLAGVLMALGGVRVAEVGADNVLVVAVDAAVLGEGGGVRKGVTHHVEVELEGGEGETGATVGMQVVDEVAGVTVRGMSISPADVEVEDLRGISLVAGVSEVLRRLSVFVRAKQRNGGR